MIFKFPIVGKSVNSSPLGLVSLPFLYEMKIASYCLLLSHVLLLLNLLFCPLVVAQVQ